MFSTDGLASFMLSMEELATTPDATIEEMLHAEADIIEEAQKKKGRAYGVHRTGVTLSSIGRGKVKNTKDGKVIHVYPQGRNKDGNRNAEVAFVNEFGTSRQAARPFIQDANAESADKAVEAAMEVWDEYLNSKGF